MNNLIKAIQFCQEKHKGQTRKVSGEPYASHPIAVSYLVASYKQSKKIEDLLIAAMLHDTLEDTETTFGELSVEFNPLVASLVLELSNDPLQVEKLGKLEYQKRKLCGVSSYGLVIKLCDRLHNILDHPSSKMVLETVELLQHLKSKRKLSKTHKKILADSIEICATIQTRQQTGEI